MKNFNFPKSLVCLFIILLTVSAATAQRRRPPVKFGKAQPIIFAITNDGTSLEPIAVVDKGVLQETTGGDAAPKALASFSTAYYKPNTTYKLIFGGAGAGVVTVKTDNPKADCNKNIATVTAASTKAKLKGLVMGLATNIPVTRASGLRRLPTTAERSEIENLVRDKLTAEGVGAAAVKNLHYHNLTAIDVDTDGKAEFVGSYWAETSAKERNQLFFIADQGAGGKYQFGFSDYKKVTADDVMSGDMKDLDNGTYAELLLDSFEYNGDKTDKIFTVTQGFEGNSFTVYDRRGGKWTKVFESSNYHCAY